MNKVLDNLKWNDTKITDIFVIKKCTRGYKTSQLRDGKIPYVARSNVNNGVTRYIGNDEKQLYPAGSITIHHEWNKFYCSFYQDTEYATDGMIYYMERKDGKPINKYEAMFICCILNNTYANFKTDKKCGLTFIKIKLPYENGKIAWDEMSKYMKSIEKNVSIKL